MRTETAPIIRLADYRPPAFMIETLSLDITLDPHRTLVRARLDVRRTAEGGDLMLDGEGLELLDILCDGVRLPADAYAVSATGLTLRAPPARFTLETLVAINPSANSALSGLYLSGGRFCTQCEAEGFRHITFALDRPDALSRYRVRLAAPAGRYKTLLSNGNLIERGIDAAGHDYAVWDDPHLKPAYLFALVAGDFDILTDTFITMSGREVALAIHVDPGDAPRAAYALDALKRSMAWDETVFGREYDLDVFNIVAVRDFNFGAMENKGLNIFNSALLLADPETATDADYEAIEAVVAHEYFHNWTGNRITLRDWFQLSLKEGLTVFRDQEFSADQRSRAVQRIKAVKLLRQRQFQEDAGPLAHPVRPASYQKIDNFYTLTVYEKGCELIRVLKTLIGDDAFEAGMALYFTRCDGTAATVEDFLACFAEASRRPLDDFKRWYGQAGTPHVTIDRRYDPAARLLTLVIRQHTPPTPGQTEKVPVPIPIRFGLLDGQGAAIPLRSGPKDPGALEQTLILTEAAQTLVFHDVPQGPVPSFLRGFSAPVVLDAGLSEAELAHLAAHDRDPFGRWEALQAIARSACLMGDTHPSALVAALGRALEQAHADAAFTALLLRLPDLPELIQLRPDADPEVLHHARAQVRHAVAAALREPLDRLIAGRKQEALFDPGAAAAGERALANAALDLLAALGPADGGARAFKAFEAARTMTDQIGALEALGASGSPDFDAALDVFYRRWRDTPLVLDKWFSVQAAANRDDALDRAQALIGHADFSLANPNQVRAVGGALPTRNPHAFHAADGRGYRLLGDLVRRVDERNPALAARLATGFETWRLVEAGRRTQARAVLEDLAGQTLSANAREIVERILG
jgi:aminopeptidase N